MNGWFLGIGGEQAGPFSEEEVAAKIRAFEVPEDALVWAEGMEDWVPVRSVPELWRHFAEQDDAELPDEEEEAVVDAASDDELPPPSDIPAQAEAPPVPEGDEIPPPSFVVESAFAPSLSSPLGARTEEEEAVEEPLEEDYEVSHTETPAPAKKTKAAAAGKKDKKERIVLASFARGADSLEAVFTADGTPKKGRSFAISRKAAFGVFLLSAVGAGAGAVYTGLIDPVQLAATLDVKKLLATVGIDAGSLFGSSEENTDDLFSGAPPPPNHANRDPAKAPTVSTAPAAGTPVASGTPGAPAVPSKAPPSADLVERQGRLEVAKKELVTNPEGALAALRKLVEDKSKDEVTQAAGDLAVKLLRSTRRNSDAGKLLLEMKRPEEAAQVFLEEPPSLSDAEAAYFAAAEQSTGPKRRQFLMEAISLAMGKLNDMPLAEKRIRSLATDFPNEPNPYAYYLKTPDDKIADIFHRLSFQFVQSLLAYVASEFPQLTLAGRPTVAVVREGKECRIIGKYKGGVNLSRDKLENIRFTFWNRGEAWFLVDTNLTREREVRAKQERSRRGDTLYSADEMLKMLEEKFKVSFSGAAVHEDAKAPPPKDF